MSADFIFVPGFTQTAESWDPVIKLLAAPARTCALADDRDFVATAAALDIGPGDYVGYSMGGRLCLQLALDRPDVVQRLALVSASPGIVDVVERAARVEADEVLARSIERDGADAFLERWVAQPLFATLPRDRAGLEERRAGHTVGSLTHQLRALGQGAQPSNWERLELLAVPVLLIVGALDTKYVDIAQRMGATIPDARVEVIPAAGHACHLEQPEQVAQLLTSW